MQKPIGCLTSFIIAFALVAAMFVFPVDAASGADYVFWRQILEDGSYSEITLGIYDKLVSVFEQTEAPKSVEFEYKATFSSPTEAQKYYSKDIINNYIVPTYYYVYNDHPEYFWLDTACSVNVNASYIGTNYTITYTVKPSYCVTSNLSTAKTNFDNAVSSMTAGLSGKSEYEKSLLLHDRLIDNTTYIQSGEHQSAYGALVSKKAVCAGYARAYKVLLDAVGIKAYYLTGTSEDPNSGASVNHSWNAVNIDGNWYYSDVTWDDQGETTYYAQFNVTKARISEDHVFDSAVIPYLPNATATAANYFTKNGCFLSDYDLDAIVSHLDKNDFTARFYYSGTKYSSASEFYKAKIYNKSSGINVFPDIVKGLGYEKSGYSYSLKSCGRELIIIINFTSDAKPTTTTTAASTTTAAASSTTKATSASQTTTVSADITTNPPVSDTSAEVSEQTEVSDTAIESEVNPDETSVSDSEETTDNTTTEPTETTEDSETGTEASDSNSDADGDSDADVDSDSGTGSDSSDNTDDSSTDISTDTPDNTVYIIIGVAAAVIVAGIIIAVVLVKKKKSEKSE